MPIINGFDTNAKQNQAALRWVTISRVATKDLLDTASRITDGTNYLTVNASGSINNVSTITGIDYVSGNSGIDAVTETIIHIDYEHHEIHSGNHFFVCGETTLGSGADVDFQLTTPNTTKWIHMTFQYESTQEILLEIYEGADVDADGTSVTAYNNNRNSTNTTGLTLLQTDGTVNTAGTMIYSQRSGVAGNANKSRQGIGSRDREIVLKQNTTYRFVFTSGGAGNNFSYCGEWYEHTSKN